jgi:CubicO group peptidase (beta-lactamase class C family)
MSTNLLTPDIPRLHNMSTVVGKLVEKLSGQKLEDYFHEHIFAPLQMSDTSYNVPLEKAARLDGSSPATGSVRRLLCPPNRRARNSMVGASSREERSFSGVGLWLSAASHE